MVTCPLHDEGPQKEEQLNSIAQSLKDMPDSTDAGAFAQAADLVLRGAKGYGHNNFKIGLARRAIVRTLSQAARGTPQSQSVKKIR